MVGETIQTWVRYPKDAAVQALSTAASAVKKRRLIRTAETFERAARISFGDANLGCLLLRPASAGIETGGLCRILNKDVEHTLCRPEGRRCDAGAEDSWERHAKQRMIGRSLQETGQQERGDQGRVRSPLSSVAHYREPDFHNAVPRSPITSQSSIISKSLFGTR